MKKEGKKENLLTDPVFWTGMAIVANAIGYTLILYSCFLS
jgi:hypothetical protein